MRSKKGLPLIVTGLLLVAAALFLTVFNLYEEQKAAQLSMAALLELPEEVRSHLPAEDAEEEPTEPELVYPDYVLNPYMDMPTVEADGHDYIGVLAIPALELELPVMSAWSYPNLKIAPCRYAGSAYLDDMVIAAHNYTRHFGRLKELSGGETVTFTDADGNVFTYEVEQVCIEDGTMLFQKAAAHTAILAERLPTPFGRQQIWDKIISNLTVSTAHLLK